jgi:hypothetical protein
MPYPRRFTPPWSGGHLTLTLVQEFREARAWFAQHKRDPFLWLVILGPLTFAAINFWGFFVFPPSDAIRAINQVLPNADMYFKPTNFPKCSGKTYIFGYNFGMRIRSLSSLDDAGRACRDIINGGWVVDINPCAQIVEACKKAGFAAGAGISGCVRPIMAGTPQQKLSQIDPRVVAACKQQNPWFGAGGR